MTPTPARIAMTAIAVAVCTLAQTASAQQNDQNVARVEITGSSIRRVAAENALPLTTIKAEELTARGLTTMSEVATSLTVGATNEPVGGGGSGTMINMRGLNTNRTLVLLNGRRLPNEAIGDSSINVDVIPMSAVERVEVLRDGASSIYGTDAIAGVVNFITKRTHTGISAMGGWVQPERHGGGDQRRFSIIGGWGNLEEQGWNAYAAFDVQKRTSLLQKDRPNISDPALIAQLGGNPFTSDVAGSSAAPANFTAYQNGKATGLTGNPYFAGGCAAPYGAQYTIPSTKASGAGKGTCILDPNLYPQLLPDNMQATLFARGSLRHGGDKLLSVELLTTESYIDAQNPPQVFGAQTDYDKYNPGVRKPLFITRTSKWYPGGAGGVPAVPGITGQDLALTWSMDEAGPATTDDRQNTHRLTVADEGMVMGWDYRVGLVAARSKRAVKWKSGFFSTPGIYQGIADGTLNPFGPQDAAGSAYLDSISRDGITYRTARVSYYGPDFNISRPLLDLAGGPLALAIGGDWHRETYRDATDPIANDVVYKVSGTPNSYPSGERTVSGLYLEADAPVTKALTITGAVRADHFSDFGNTVNPKLSVRWQPIEHVMVRGTASTGFRAPTLPELYGTPQTRTPSTGKWDDPLLCPSATPSVPGTGSLTTDPRYAGLNLDPARVCNTTLVTLTGANPALEPEKAKTVTAGIVLSPVKNLVVSFDWWSIRMRKTIAQITEDTIFADVDRYANLFVRNPDGTLDYIVKTRLNMGGLRTRGIDTSFSYTFPTTDWGKFGASLDGTYVDRYEGQNDEGGEWVDSVGRPGALATGSTSANTYVYRWKHNLRVSWNYKQLGLQLTQAYTAHYEDTNAQPNQKPGQPYFNEIDHYTLYNLTANWAFSKELKLTLGINNLLDEDPPLSNQRIGSRVVFAQNVSKPIGRAYNVRVNYTF
ncbi:iron complex outermembrane receptor protein [Pseudoduganella flava]|uniref:Iron complex outermembrane receptor protein n=1 Tax=Pseudoduganella flava TaxID=871742 RepID=A0A562Q031_9BURK|nr:TonB-dependent receptor [Pseudoduganella flava]QGZ38629.1 TonB-dependent receptor [Pseudoduganella flava]TWI49800.1 iron complex outermembrane receptor protein [Pseudoduganella flava]